MRERKTHYHICIGMVLVSLTTLAMNQVMAEGPRRNNGPVCARYSVPPSLLKQSYQFAGETIPLDREDVRIRIRDTMNFLLMDARSVLTRWIIEGGRRQWLFEEILTKEGIPTEFVWFAPVISGNGTSSPNRLPGVGWWAIETPCSSREGIALSKDSWHDDRLDLELATKCFAMRLKAIRKELGTNSWLMAAAAYVTSTKSMLGYMEHWKTKNFWDIPLPETAEQLVLRWIAVCIIQSNAEALGLTIRQPKSLTYDSVTGIVLQKDLPISRMAQFIHTPVRTVLALNPKIKSSFGKVPAKVNGKRIKHSLATPRGKGWTLVKQLKKNGYLLTKRK